MNSWSAPSEMPSDAAQGDASPDLKRFADAVLREGQSLLVVRARTDSLHSIIQRLQPLWLSLDPQLKVEHFSGRLSAGLLGLINATLAQQALPAAMQSTPRQPVRHLCVVHDAECLSQDELLLLQRVIEHFPGWKTRLVLLYKTALDTSEKLQLLLQQPGQGLLVWQPHTPAPEPAPSRTHPRNRHWLTALSLLAVLGCAWLWLPTPNAPTQAPQPPTGQMPAPGIQPMTTSAPTQPAVTAQQPALSAQDGASAAQESMPPTPEARPEPAPQAMTASAPVPDVAMRGQRWLSGLSREFFVIVHGSHERLDQALRQIDSRSELNSARVIMLNTTATEASRFLVITGPFRSMERAQNFKIRQNLPASSEIEPVGTVLDRSRTQVPTRP